MQNTQLVETNYTHDLQTVDSITNRI